MPSKKIAESRYYDATVVAVLWDRWVHLEVDGKDRLRLLSCPDEYREPKVGDRVKLEERLELRPGYLRRTWDTDIIRWPVPERWEIQDLVGYDS